MLSGRVARVAAMTAGIAGLSGHLALGDRVRIRTRAGGVVGAEVVALRDGRAETMCHDRPEGLGLDDIVLFDPRARAASLAVGPAWIGRVVAPDGAPLDGRGALPPGPARRTLRAAPPPATRRARLGPRLDLGVPALDLFATCRQGQRLGLFAASGIGKSTLLAMLARNAECDVAVLALVGERGREVREFLEDDLGAAAARCVTVVATSDESPLRRRDAAHAALAIAEHFRDGGARVLLLLDSVTRYCMALREIALAAGEPPATRGYPPSVFSELPRLLERAGPGAETGAAVPPGDPAADRPGRAGFITALFTVLVEGDDHDEPVADAVRGILDGHVVLDRGIAERGRYPAIDVLRSLSRSVPGCLSAAEWHLVRRARDILARAGDLADLVRLGAYQPGRDAAADHALALAPSIEALLTQGRHEVAPARAAFRALAAALGEPAPGDAEAAA
jgi:flagellum-specific ATP synthase